MIKSLLDKLHFRVWARQLPKIVTLTDFDPDGLRFEAIGVTELHRILYRGDEQDYLDSMLNALHPDDVLYDIGANIGLVTLHAARRCRTVAFEPDPEFFSRLQRNLELNQAINAEVLPFAISDSDGTVSLFTDGADGNSPSLVHQRNESRTVDVQAYTLDTLVEGGTLPPPTVLKFDIEGAEVLALRGAKNLLQGPRAPRALFLEVHDAFLPAFGSSAEEVLGIVRRAGYETVLYEARRYDQQHLIVAQNGETS